MTAAVFVLSCVSLALSLISLARTWDLERQYDRAIEKVEAQIATLKVIQEKRA